jgi:hypothetical protein
MNDTHHTCPQKHEHDSDREKFEFANHWSLQCLLLRNAITLTQMNGPIYKPFRGSRVILLPAL